LKRAARPRPSFHPACAKKLRSPVNSDVRLRNARIITKSVKTPQIQPTRHTTAADTSAAVDELMGKLVHGYKSEISAIRKAILGASPGIAEGVKWNAPSFRTHEYFATTNLREKGGIGVILHLGARVRNIGPGALQISDPSGLLHWLAPDRASVKFKDSRDFEGKRSAFVQLIRSWIKHV
jgi:hypothetical protein